VADLSRRRSGLRPQTSATSGSEVNDLRNLFQNNRRWARRILRSDQRFFDELAQQQSPGYLWIGCSDSRVPANEIVGLLPGELFVHRNIGNVVVHSDLNCLSVIQFGVDVLKVRHIIVCGHYRCSGVRAAMMKERHGLVDNWLRHIQDVRQQHERRLRSMGGRAQLVDRLCELNVIEQVANVCRTSIVEDAWTRGQRLTVHGWIYGIHDGLLRDLGFTAGSSGAAVSGYRRAVERSFIRR
jgi:carbonic anhydrase